MSDSASLATELLDGVETNTVDGPVPADQGLALVAREGGFGDRYRVWRGRSGHRYLVTVMPLGEAMRVDNAVVLIVAIGPDGERRVLYAGETSAGLPGLHVAAGHRLEAHVHLIAASPAKRQSAVDDLLSATQGYSAVLTTSAAASHASVGSVTPSSSNWRAVFST